MMFWPSMMSLAPPPVTPSRKFPPRLGCPAGCVGLVDGDEPLLPQAARPPTTARPPAPASNCRREISAMAEPLLSVGADAARGACGGKGECKGRALHHALLTVPKIGR